MKIRTQLSRLALALSLGGAVAFAPLRAEEPAAQHQAAPAEHAAEHGHEAPAAEHGAEAGHEAAAHEGAAHEGGHEGGHAAHHGPEIKLFGHVFDDGGQWGLQLFNFAIFAGGLFFALKGALSSAFKNRAEELERQLRQAEVDKAEGEAQIRELEAKMAGLEDELKGILSKAETDAEAEKLRVVEAAKAEAAAILAQAQSEIDYQKRLAEKELKALVAQLAVEAAGQRLTQKLQGDAAARTVDHAIQQIGSQQGGIQ